MGHQGLCGLNIPACCSHIPSACSEPSVQSDATLSPARMGTKGESLGLASTPTSCLLLSRESRATKADICSRKSRSTAKPEVRAKVRTAGMGVRAPEGWGGGPRVNLRAWHLLRWEERERGLPASKNSQCLVGRGCSGSPKKKQMASERLQRSMLGATLPRARPMWASRSSPGLRGSLCVGTAGTGSRSDQGLCPSQAGREQPHALTPQGMGIAWRCSQARETAHTFASGSRPC